MREDLHFQEQISGSSAGAAFFSFAGDPNGLSGAHSPRQIDLDATRLGASATRQAELSNAARQGFFQTQWKNDLLVGARTRPAAAAFVFPRRPAATAAARPGVCAGPCLLAEEHLEEVGESGGAAGKLRAAAEALETLEAGESTGATGRSAGLLALLPIGAELVVFGPLVGVFEYLIGLGNLFEAGFRALLFAHVGMVLARQLPIGLLDLLRRSVARHTQNLVVILEIHPSSLS